MRRVILSVVSVAVAVVLQLTTINGLHLPGGAVPDLVLLVVAALGLAGGPVSGAITGFAAGLCLDLAPPGSGVVGEYALAFCLVGWACGRFRGSLTRSALLPIVITAAGAVIGEILIAALGLALQPAQVAWTSVRQVLPAALLYDVVVSPFVLYLVLLAGAWLRAATAGPLTGRGRALAGRVALVGGLLGRPGRAGLAGLVSSGSAGGPVLLSRVGWLAGPPQGRRARKAAARRTPRLRPGSGRAGDGWLGGSAAARRALGGPVSGGQAFRGQASRGQGFRGQALTDLARDSRPHGSGPARLRSGVAGSATEAGAPRTLAARPVHLRLASGRKRDGKVGNLLGRGRPVMGGFGAGGFRGGRSRGTASVGKGSVGKGFVGKRSAGQGPVVISRGLSRGHLARLGRRGTGRRGGRGGGFRPAAMPGGSAVSRQAGLGPVGRPGRSGSRGHLAWFAPVRFGTGRRRDGLVGGGVLSRVGPTGRRAAAPRLRIRPGGGVLSRVGPTGRRPAAPRFRVRPGGALTGPAVAAGGGSDGLQVIRRQAPRQRLRMHGRRGDGMLGGSAAASRGGPASRTAGGTRPAAPRFRARPIGAPRPQSGKRPRFGYRRWSVVSLLTRRHAGRPRVRLGGRKRAGGAG